MARGVGGVPWGPAVLAGAKMGTDIWKDITEIRAMQAEERRKTAVEDRAKSLAGFARQYDNPPEGMVSAGPNAGRPVAEVWRENRGEMLRQIPDPQVALGASEAARTRDRERAVKSASLDLLQNFTTDTTVGEFVARAPQIFSKYQDLRPEDMPTLVEQLKPFTQPATERAGLEAQKAAAEHEEAVRTGKADAKTAGGRLLRDPRVARMPGLAPALEKGQYERLAKLPAGLDQTQVGGATVVRPRNKLGELGDLTTIGIGSKEHPSASGKSGGERTREDWLAWIDKQHEATRADAKVADVDTSAADALIEKGDYSAAVGLLMNNSGGKLTADGAKRYVESVGELSMLRRQGMQLLLGGRDPFALLAQEPGAANPRGAVGSWVLEAAGLGKR
jgi:hypothetical protein